MKQMIWKRSLTLLFCLTLLSSLLTVGVSAMSSQAPEYLIRDEYYQETEFPTSLLESLEELAESGTENKVMDVRDLMYAELYEIVIRQGYDETVYAAIYRIDGVFYYLNYVELDNSHFDAYGNFSYRRGEVVITDATAYDVGIENCLVPFYQDFTEYYEDDYSDGVYMVIFWIAFVILGFLAPIPFLIVGFALSCSKKLGQPRYWRILSYIAIFWIFLSLLLLVLILLV